MSAPMFRPRALVLALGAAAWTTVAASGCGEEKKKADPVPPWTQVAKTFDAPLNAVRVMSPTEAVAVGGGGLIVQFDGKAWEKVDGGTEADLLALWAGPDGALVAVGTGGTLVTRKDGAWTATQERHGVTLRAVCGVALDDLWVFGDDGLALHDTGAGVAEVDVPQPELVRSCYIDPDGSGTGYLVGDESGVGTVTLAYDGEASWARIVRSNNGIGSVADLEGRLEPMERVPFIWGAAANTAGNGVLARWQDERWGVVVAGLPDRPLSVLPTGEGLWLGGTSVLMRVDAASPDDAPETQVVAGPIRDLAGVETLLVAVGGQTKGTLWTRTPAQD